MKEIYQRFATNTILNSKVDDVYFAVLQYKMDYLLSYPEFVDSLYMPKEQIKLVIQAEEELSKAGYTQKEIRKIILDCSEANYFGLLIKVGDRVFDIYHQTYVDFNQLKVVKYDNLAKFYDDADFCPRLANPNACNVFPYRVAAIDLTNWDPFEKYKNSIYDLQGTKDLTSQFKREIGIDNSRYRK